MAHEPLVAADGRPYPCETRNGDAWVVHRRPDSCRIALIDGLGHGPAAADAADAARAALDARPDLDPSDAVAACHVALAGSRGAALAVARIDCLAGQLTYAGVGNIEARLCVAGHWQRPISYRGIVGATLPRLRAFTFALSAPWLLVMHTDGLRGRFEIDAPTTLRAAALQPLAESLLRDWARPTDDASIVLVMSRAALGLSL
jgi:hypothetical protein